MDKANLLLFALFLLLSISLVLAVSDIDQNIVSKQGQGRQDYDDSEEDDEVKDGPSTPSNVDMIYSGLATANLGQIIKASLAFIPEDIRKGVVGVVGNVVGVPDLSVELSDKGIRKTPTIPTNATTTTSTTEFTPIRSVNGTEIEVDEEVSEEDDEGDEYRF